MRMTAAVVIGLLALVAARPASCTSPVQPLVEAGPAEVTVVPYTDLLARLGTERTTLAAEWRKARDAKARAAVVARAREAAFRAIVNDLFPPWFGTTWDFNGTSQTPGEGTIACGYFVSTVLRDAGFKVERIRLAQQASEKIVLSLVPDAAITRYRNRTPEDVIEAIRAGDDGLYAVGFDYHVGFVVKEGETLRFCHSSWLGPNAVTCEDPATSGAWYSTYYVVGRLLEDPMLIAWLEEKPIPTRRS